MSLKEKINIEIDIWEKAEQEERVVGNLAMLRITELLERCHKTFHQHHKNNDRKRELIK